jgi:sugar O-acyltransferase (sialic acid O-acetyltransferase NeuD family)
MPEPGAADWVLWGSAGHAKVLAALLALRGQRVVALFDNNADATSALPGVPLHRGEDGFTRWADGATHLGRLRALVAIGGARGRDRLALQDLMQRHGLAAGLAVHPQASVCHSARLGEGTQVLALALVAAEARLGRACIVNHAASVDHECQVGDGVHLAPGARLCGCVQVGDAAFIGAGAVVLPRLRIGADAVVGAGAVVIHDVAAGARVVGNPARPLP